MPNILIKLGLGLLAGLWLYCLYAEVAYQLWKYQYRKYEKKENSNAL
jgi:hypothetical protein